MLAAHLGEGLVGALDDALRADVDPAAGRHLAVHHEALAIELVEHLPIRPFGHEVGVGDQHPRRILVGAEHANRLARLDEQGLVFLQPLERLDDLVVAFPVARGAADSAIDDEALRVLGDLIVEIVHQHPHRGLGGPMLGLDFAATAGADVAAVVASVGHYGAALSGWSGADPRGRQRSIHTSANPARMKPSAIPLTFIAVWIQPSLPTSMKG